MVFRVIAAPPQTIVSWWDEKADLDLDPPYQRKGEIWSVKQEQDLIDTILNSFDIPKLYFADFTLLDSPLNNKRKRYAVIDGKQRMLAIYGFFEGRFTLSKNFVLFDDPELKLGGLSYDDLVSNYPKLARKFSNYSLSIMSVVTDDEQKINELFIRLNSSKPLVGAEIRNAMLGLVPELIREIVTLPFWKKVGFSTKRGQDKNLAAKLLLLEHAGTFVDTKKRQLDELVTENATPDITVMSEASEEGEEADIITEEDFVDAVEGAETSDIDRAKQRLISTLGRITPRFVDHDPILRQQAQIPVIYWMCRELDDSELAKLRPFLVAFDNERLANREREIGDPDRDFELIDYELMTRTSNDRASISGRYRILRKRFLSYLEQNPG